MFATGETVGLTEWIIDNTYLFRMLLRENAKLSSYMELHMFVLLEMIFNLFERRHCKFSNYFKFFHYITTVVTLEFLIKILKNVSCLYAFLKQNSSFFYQIIFLSSEHVWLFMSFLFPLNFPRKIWSQLWRLKKEEENYKKSVYTEWVGWVIFFR